MRFVEALSRLRPAASISPAEPTTNIQRNKRRARQDFGCVCPGFGARARAGGFFQTELQSLLFKRALPGECGAVMGIGQSSSSLARRAGHAGSGTLDGQFGGAPSYFGGAAMLGAFLAASGLQRLIAAEQSAPKAQC